MKGEFRNWQGRQWEAFRFVLVCAVLIVATSCSTENKRTSTIGTRTWFSNREGIAAHDVARAQREFDVDGSGVRVCVLSDSIRHLDKAKDITPQDVTVLEGQAGIEEDDPDENKPRHKHRGKDKGEGTAMLEIIHSIAPAAELMFATAGHKASHMADNIRSLAKMGCKIFVDDKEFFYQSPFQDDDISKAVNEVTAQGILYITSAGNQGNTKAGTSAAWEGQFKAGSVLKDSRGRPVRTMHSFASGEEYKEVLGNCSDVDVHLFWSDPILQGGDRPPFDPSGYELWALNANGVLKDEEGNYVTSAPLEDERGNSLTAACPGDVKGKCGDDTTTTYTRVEKPCRHICFPLPITINSRRTWIAITKVAGKAERFLHLDISGGCRLQRATGGSITGHHGAASVFSVAAKSALKRDSARNPDTGAFLGGPAENVNISSSEGPRRMYFTADGHPYNGWRDLHKPDVTAADGVTTDVKGFEPFFGTSAAAPQVAGIAALMWSKDPNLTAEQIKLALKISAKPIGGAIGWNPLSGCGVVNAFRAMRAIEKVKSHEASSRDAEDCRQERRE